MTSVIEQKVKDTFYYLHEHAEISWEETETTQYIKNVLEVNNCDVTVFDDSTGVIGKYGCFDNNFPVVGIRADIDALWQEVDGTFQANHSCGHDAHMSMVLGVLWKLEQHPEMKDYVALKFIFQPAEEKGTGALKMVENGVIDDVDYLFGVHLRPHQETAMNRATPVIVHGATKTLNGTIKGEDAHGARPHLNTNAIEVGAQIAHMLADIHLDPCIPFSVKMTGFQAGGKSENIIPGSATFSIDMRAQDNDAMEQLDGKVAHCIEMIKNLYGLNLETRTNGIAAAKTDEDAIRIMEKAIKTALGEDKADAPLVTPGGDDFHFYTIKKPSLKATMLGLGCDLKPGLHHPEMTFDTSALMNGTNILYSAIAHMYDL